MKLQSVKYYQQPSYPTQDYLLVHPELLRFVPKRWQHNRVVLTALAATACLIYSSKSFAECEDDSTKAKSIVAPIFVHGDGRGSYGCEVVSPPVYLSEAEAFQIIQDEAQKAGIQFVSKGRKLNNISVPYSERQFWISQEKQIYEYLKGSGRDIPDSISCPNGMTVDEQDSLKCPEAYQESVSRNLILDGYCASQKIGFEYVSREDYEDWKQRYLPCPIEPMSISSAYSEYYLNVASKFRDAMELEVAKRSNEKKLI